MLQRDLPFAALMLVLAAIAVARADEVDEFLNAEMQRQRVPGLLLVVTKDGENHKGRGLWLGQHKAQNARYTSNGLQDRFGE